MDPILYTYQQAAKILTLSQFTLRRHVSRGRIGYTKLGAKTVRFTPEQLQEFIDSGRREPRT